MVRYCCLVVIFMAMPSNDLATLYPGVATGRLAEESPADAGGAPSAEQGFQGLLVARELLELP